MQWVQSFYDSAWNRLIWVVGSAIVFVGIIGAAIPLIIQFIQSRTFRDEMSRLEGNANKQIELSKAESKREIDNLKAEYRREMDDTKVESKKKADDLKAEAGRQIEESKRFFAEATDKLQKDNESAIKAEALRLEKRNNIAMGGVFLVQGITMINSKRNAEGIMSYSWAASYYIDGEDEADGRVGIGNLKGVLGTLVTAKDFVKDQTIEKALIRLIEFLSNQRFGGRYANDVEEINKLWTAAKVKPAPQA